MKNLEAGVKMNTTPDFEEIGKTVQLEARWYLVTLAAARLCLVAFAMYVGVLQLIHIGFWSGFVDRALLLAGLWVGLGLYGDAIEFVWRKLGILGRFLVLSVALVLVAGTILTQGNLMWHSVSMVGVLLVLCSLAFGLVQILQNPSRAMRFRQIKRYLRTLPIAKRRAIRQRLDLNFQTLCAEGFD